MFLGQSDFFHLTRGLRSVSAHSELIADPDYSRTHHNQQDSQEFTWNSYH